MTFEGLKPHLKILTNIGVISIIGIFASIVFQIITGRLLGPDAFGLLSAFLAIVSIAAYGSSALQNSVAVSVAHQIQTPITPTDLRKTFSQDGSWKEALYLGGIGTVSVLALSPLITSYLSASYTAVILAALAIAPNFYFSRAQGIIQGSGAAISVVSWTTILMVLRLLLALLVLWIGLGAIALLFTILISTVTVAVGASRQASRLNIFHRSTPFNKTTLVVICLTIAGAWLTNIDTVLVRGGASESISGNYAAAAVLSKFILIAPTMLSIYLLPRFVKSSNDRARTNLGVNIVLLAILTAGLCYAGLYFVFANPVTHLLFGSKFTDTAAFLPWLTLAYVPWALCQGILIRLQARTSSISLAVLVATCIAQMLLALAFLPNIWGFIASFGILGTICFLALLIIHFSHNKAA